MGQGVAQCARPCVFRYWSETRPMSLTAHSTEQPRNRYAARRRGDRVVVARIFLRDPHIPHVACAASIRASRRAYSDGRPEWLLGLHISVRSMPPYTVGFALCSGTCHVVTKSKRAVLTCPGVRRVCFDLARPLLRTLQPPPGPTGTARLVPEKRTACSTPPTTVR